jgi:phenylacetate-CoA ligase
MSETKPHYLIVVDRVNNLDTLQILVEVEELYFDKISQLQGLRDRLQQQVESTLGISAEIKLVEPKTIERFEGKAPPVIDKRTF